MVKVAIDNSNMKKIKIKGYCHKTWDKGGFKQIALLPSPYITYNPQGNFIEQGVSTSLWIISINFLIWDFGFMFFENIIYPK
jgi:hypothetical protein